MKGYPVLLLSAVLLGSVRLVANSAIEPAARDEKWLRRHEAFLREARRGGVQVLFLGDSITDAWRTDGRVLWEEHFAPLSAANFGIDGDRTQNVLWRIQHGTLEGLAPKAIVLLIGTNNTGMENGRPIPRNTTAEAIAGVEAVVRALRERLPGARILLLGILPRGEKDDPHRAQIREINGALAEFSDGVEVRFLDIGAAFLSPDGSLSRQLMPDLVHPNEAGYAVWAAAIKTPLQQMLASAPAKAP